MVTPSLEQGALLSPDQRYRYLLWRRWGIGPPVCWVMLNPSTADHRVDDPTIRRCLGFTRQWGYDAMVVVNLFAIRATVFPGQEDDFVAAPEFLYHRFVGFWNDLWLKKATGVSPVVVGAWGVGGALFNRGVEVYTELGLDEMWCLGETKNGYPRHPLYVPKLTELVPWTGCPSL